MKRFALVLTNDPALTRWEVHKSDCPDVRKLSEHGAFANYLTAQSPEELCERELGAFPKIDQSTSDCKIMPCCAGTRKNGL